MTITVVGSGYVGLTAAAVFAKLGHTVWLIRRDQKKIEQLKQGIMPFYEPGLKEIVRHAIADGRLKPTHEYAPAVGESEIVFICVGTPPMSNGQADLNQVYNAATSIAKTMTGFTVVVNKSTVPIGTAMQVKEILEKNKSSGAEYAVASCPEFLREGTAISDSFNPDRVVIGTEDERAKKLLTELHATLPGERVFCDIKTAEMIKYASNSLLATEISFINSIAQLCERGGANVEDVARGMKLDKRIGLHAFLNAGCGYGGSCFPKDIKALIHIARSNGNPLPLLEAVESVNEAQKSVVYQKLRAVMGDLSGETIAVWGIAFKPETDDIREAPALRLVETLALDGATIRAYDRIAQGNAQRLYPHVQYCSSPLEALDGADALCIMTEWEEFSKLDLEEIKRRLRAPIIVDGRNIFDPHRMKVLGFNYQSVGRPFV